jgi:hypothetical protein
MDILGAKYLKLERSELFDFYLLEKNGKIFSVNRNKLEITNRKGIFDELKKMKITCALRKGSLIIYFFDANGRNQK